MNTCVYLNLPSAEDRRASLEASFAAAPRPGWALDRFEAIGPDQAGAAPGPLSLPEKGCFLSHRAAIGRHADTPGHLFVAEDDAVFSVGAFGVMDAVHAHAPQWDVILADAALFDLNLLVRLARARDGMAARGQFEIIDVRGRSWAGATAYSVRDTAKARLHAALGAAALDKPYDLFLRDLANDGALRVGVCFPFVTTVSAHGDGSQIQADEHALFDFTLNAYRRLMHIDRDLDQCRQDYARLQASCDETSRMVGAVFASIVSPGFPIDR